MSLILPFDFSYWIGFIFGDSAIFTSIAILTIFGLAAYFRMTNLMAIMMVLAFALLLYPFGITGGLLVAITVVLVIIGVPIMMRLWNR